MLVVRCLYTAGAQCSHTHTLTRTDNVSQWPLLISSTFQLACPVSGASTFYTVRPTLGSQTGSNQLEHAFAHSFMAPSNAIPVVGVHNSSIKSLQTAANGCVSNRAHIEFGGFNRVSVIRVSQLEDDQFDWNRTSLAAECDEKTC